MIIKSFKSSRNLNQTLIEKQDEKWGCKQVVILIYVNVCPNFAMF